MTYARTSPPRLAPAVAALLVAVGLSTPVGSAAMSLVAERVGQYLAARVLDAPRPQQH